MTLCGARGPSRWSDVAHWPEWPTCALEAGHEGAHCDRTQVWVNWSRVPAGTYEERRAAAAAQRKAAGMSLRRWG